MILIALSLGFTLHYTLILLTSLRILSREGREPAARVAWLLVVRVLPFLGVVIYFVFGEIQIGRRARERMRWLLAQLPNHPQGEAPLPVEARFGAIFARAAAVNGFAPTAGNHATLARDTDDAIDRLVADIDAAQDHVHLLFYIWLPDGNGMRVIDAVRRAAARGVACRCLVDGMGSRLMLRHAAWRALPAAGVETGVTFPISIPFLRRSVSRMDIRNHRKIAVIDHDIVHVGSQNCADAAFAIKPRYAPWVDVMLRIEGPVAWQMQHLFVLDWMTHTGADIAAVLRRAPPPGTGTVAAIGCGTGPNVDIYAVSDLFQLAAALAQESLVITTPYYVPTEALTQAIRSAALRGVRVRMILPARNDSRFVALASRSYYLPLLRAGVEIREFRPGLLHAKVVTVDDRAILVGSANMDRRSFELNYENSMLLLDPAIAAAMRDRQADWAAQSDGVTLDTVGQWSVLRRAVQNLVATIGPLL